MEVLETRDTSLKLSPTRLDFKDDVLYISSTTKVQQEHRNNSDNVFFDGNVKLETQPLLPMVLKQIRVNKDAGLQLDYTELKLEQKLNKIIGFFNKFAFVDIVNFKLIQGLLSDYFSYNSSLKDSISRFKEEIDKYSRNNHNHGKLYVSTAVKGNSLRLTLTRSKAKDTKQYISFSLDENLQSELLVYTTDLKADTKRSSVIRNCMLKNRSFNQSPESINFDAGIWKSFNFAGIHRKDYLKTLDCIERNRLNLSKFINTVNKKDLSNILTKDLISQIKIKTDNKHILCLSFVTSQGQKVEAKLTKDAVSLSILETT